MGRSDGNVYFSLSVSVDLKTYERLELARGDVSRSKYVRDAIKAKTNHDLII